jgi:ankyrin repeat protein
MNSTLLSRILILLACLPIAVFAETYKCQQPDGSTTYQDRACSSGSSGSRIESKSPPPSPAFQALIQQRTTVQTDIQKKGGIGLAEDSREPSSSLTDAINSNNKNTAILLLEKGADVNDVDHWYKTALDYAALKPGWSDIVQKIIEHGAICGAVRNNSSPIDTAADFESIKLLKACVLKQTGILFVCAPN